MDIFAKLSIKAAIIYIFTIMYQITIWCIDEPTENVWFISFMVLYSNFTVLVHSQRTHSWYVNLIAGFNCLNRKNEFFNWTFSFRCLCMWMWRHYQFYNSARPPWWHQTWLLSDFVLWSVRTYRVKTSENPWWYAWGTKLSYTQSLPLSAARYLVLAPVPQDLCWEVIYGQSPIQVCHGYERQAGNNKREETFKKIQQSRVCLKIRFRISSGISTLFGHTLLFLDKRALKNYF